MAEYYDFVLGAIPIAAASVATVLFFGGITASIAISLGCMVAAGLVGHAMFVRTPTSEPGTASSPSQSAFEVAD
ncbi:MAG: hypothetical protein ABEJ05_04045 [Haloglomus sp.]